MTQRAWNVPPASLVFGLLVCLALSTQFLFQRHLYDEWSVAAIASAWIRILAGYVGVAASIVAALWLAGHLAVRRAVAQVAWFCVALLAGAWLGEWSALWVQWGARPTADFAAMLPRVLRWLPIGLVAGAILVARERTRDIAARLHALEVRRLQIEQQQTAVQLQVLQSQIEPHFLFNTLATIRRLQHTDPARGQETLAGFIDYLKSSLPEMRSTETTLGRELDLIGAYLDVLQVRMGDRLRVQIDAAPSLRRQRIPPLSIATLVENAIKHGIGSLLEGGTVSVSAWIDEGALHVRVADTGLGFAASEGTGTGLANLRMRLRALYGDAGGLTLAPNAPRGFAATLRVPATRDGYD